MKDEFDQIAEDYLGTFTTDEGKRVYEDLKRAYYYRSSFDTDPYKTAYQEGQRSVIIRLINLMSKKEQL
tara:strand:+ start:4537 stop:4743 length:207 start_codon:yes stop_codon:yes gene_type:complete